MQNVSWAEKFCPSKSKHLSLFQPSADELKAAEALYTMADDLLFQTFYRALKARAMMHDEAVPLQFLRRDTIDRADDERAEFRDPCLAHFHIDLL